MRMPTTVAMAAVVSLVPLSSDGQGRTALPQADVDGINELSEAFATAVLARDWKTVTALYVPDAVLYPPGEAAVTGRAAIEACLAALPAIKDFTLRNRKVEGRDDLAYVQGTYTMTMDLPGASEPVQESGYYVEVRRRQPDGRWLIAVQMLTPHE